MSGCGRPDRRFPCPYGYEYVQQRAPPAIVSCHNEKVTWGQPTAPAQAGADRPPRRVPERERGPRAYHRDVDQPLISSFEVAAKNEPRSGRHQEASLYPQAP